MVCHVAEAYPSRTSVLSSYITTIKIFELILIKQPPRIDGVTPLHYAVPESY